MTTLLEPRTGALAAAVGLTYIVSSGTCLPITRDLDRLVPGTGVWTAQVPQTLAGITPSLAHTLTSDFALGRTGNVGSTSPSLVVELKERADITWDQLAKTLGVSRRAVHHWASGGRMAAGNEESVLRLLHIVDRIHSEERDEGKRRRAIFAAVDAMRSSRAAASDDVNRPATTYEASPTANR